MEDAASIPGRSNSPVRDAAWQGLYCFVFSALAFLISFFTSILLGHTSELFYLHLWGPSLYFCLINFILRYRYKGFLYEVSVRSTILGCAFATGVYLISYSSPIRMFGLYMSVLAFFHFSEFLVMALSNPRTITVDSFIMNHSIQYTVAAVGSWVEFFLEWQYVPAMKSLYWLSVIGVIICVFGELLRKGAMLTAKTNFTHVVQYVKSSDHKLVTHGVYSLCRHPSYVGWFYWSIGTQIILQNPVCLLLYIFASWTFFNERVYGEEMTLVAFFGPDYLRYQKVVGTGLPFIKGYTASREPYLEEDDDR